ncbi:MAG: formylglycine-generating enzyme family protein [Spirochaetes bacterium]|nr:formylglycine-generating enzyme family protein [Spirochaetota bacterium]
MKSFETGKRRSAFLAIFFFVFTASERSAAITETPITGNNNIVEIAAENTVEMEFVWIPAGSFQMGSSGNEWRAQPPHQVTLTQGFFMGRTPVTQAQWEDVMIGNTNNISATPSRFSGNPSLPVEQVSWYDILVFANRLSTAKGLEPVYRINGSTNPEDWGYVPTMWNDPLRPRWDAVEKITGANGFRLPTEAQWEFAARAGTTTSWSFGNEVNTDYMWFSANSNNRTQEVGTRPPNPWGLYDMHGNVWEWVWDWFGNFTPAAGIDPMGPASGTLRVGRGGGWGHTEWDTRSADRGGVNPPGRGGSGGFRLVRP